MEFDMDNFDAEWNAEVDRINAEAAKVDGLYFYERCNFAVAAMAADQDKCGDCCLVADCDYCGIDAAQCPDHDAATEARLVRAAHKG